MRKVELLPTRDCEAGYGPEDMTDHKEKRMQKCVIRAVACGGNLRAGVQGRAGGGADWDSKWRLSIDL